MNQVNKKLYIITTRVLNKHGFLNDQFFEKRELSLDTPIIQFLINGFEEALVSWIYALSEDGNSNCLQEVLKLLDDSDLSVLNDPHLLLDLITKEHVRDILKQFSQEFTEFERDNLISPTNECDCFSYFEKEYDDIRVIALPHLPIGRSSCSEDNRCWTNALIETFAQKGEEIRMVLHEKDIYGYQDLGMGLQDKECVNNIVGRDDVELFLFQHNGGSIDKTINIADYEKGINELERIFNEWIADREDNNML